MSNDFQDNEGLQEKPRTGGPPFLTSEKRDQLSQYIKDKANDTQGGRLTGADIHAYIVKEFGKQLYRLPTRPHGLFIDNFPLKTP
nr:hypothetical protein [uncultured Vibrio sp.]